MVFVSPPYLGGTDTRACRAYNANRFARDDFEELLRLTGDADLSGVAVVLCWTREEVNRLKGGGWLTIGTDAVWLSQSIVENLHGRLGR